MSQFPDVCILVTGATGFIGRHLVDRLCAEGVRVLALGRSALPPPALGPRPRLTYLPCDFADPESLRTHQKALQEVELVAHLGGAVLRSSDPKEDNLENLAVNVLGTGRLLSFLPSTLGLFCYTSTLDVYGPPMVLPIREDHPTRPESYYAASKLAAEAVLHAYSSKTGVALAILRLSQVYGPGDSSQKLIPQVVRAAVRKQPPILHGSGDDVRDYVYVDDVVDSVVEVLRQRVHGTFNIATGQGHSIRETVNLTLAAAGFSHAPVWQPAARPPRQIVLDIRRASAAFGYQPKVGLEDGLARTIAACRGAEGGSS